jgi:serine carboxypeptidase-like clade II
VTAPSNPTRPPPPPPRPGSYVPLDGDSALFYVHAEAAPSAPADAPLIMWLNGGPGCSSLAYGFMEEVGPLVPNADGKGMRPNPYGWHGAAHMVWVESPVNVGFSYSNLTSPEYGELGGRWPRVLLTLAGAG